MTALSKVIHPCNTKIYTGRYVPVFCKINFFDGKLSISGVVGPKSNGDAYGGCGQIDGEFDHLNKSQNDARYHDLIKADALDFAPGWDAAKWYKFLDIWDCWHLNDMRPGCEHQEMMGWDKEPIDPARPTTDYDKFDGQSPTWNLKGWVYPPLGHLTEPCPVCGYKYGTAWKMVDVPAEVIDFLANLPDTDLHPAWV